MQKVQILVADSILFFSVTSEHTHTEKSTAYLQQKSVRISATDFVLFATEITPYLDKD